MSAISVYFTDKIIRFSGNPAIGGEWYISDENEEISIAKVIKIFETVNSIGVYDPTGVQFGRFALCFKQVEAAGGIVRNLRGEVLMIRLRGRWDLPNGHIEAGELPEECAVREIAEETGIEGAKIERPLCNTWHAYNVYGEWELKRTHWFALSVAGDAEPRPQSEEAITCATWCSAEQTACNLQDTYPTIRDVFQKFVNE